MKSLMLLTAMVGIFILMGCAKQQDNSDQVLQTPEAIETRLGEDLVISLESNPTTGYSWRLSEPLPSVLELKNQKFTAAKNAENTVGAAGLEEWTLRSIKKGQATVTFEYVRPWEKDKPPIKRKTFLITSK